MAEVEHCGCLAGCVKLQLGFNTPTCNLETFAAGNTIKKETWEGCGIEREGCVGSKTCNSECF